MGTSKAAYFSDKQNEIANLIRALAHPARVAIVEFLLSVDTCICGDIVNKLPLSQATISQHLKELKTVGIIKGNIEGNAICYCIDEEVWQKLQNYFSAVSLQLAEKKRQCC